MVYFTQKRPLLQQLARHGLEFDQKLARAFEVSASKPDIEPEDSGFPDSYLTLALYRLNSVLTQIVELDESRYNLFHDYRLAPRCSSAKVVPDERLCRVLEVAAGLPGTDKTIGAGHFLRTVVHLTLDQEAEPAYGFEGQVVHNTFSAETLLWGLGYSAWTPVSDAPELRDILAALDARSPIDDFQYVVTLEEQRLVFRPTSVLDAFPMARVGKSPTNRVALLTHFRDQFACVTPDELLELEDLINSPKAGELDLQRFFELHPQFLRMWDFREVFPQVYLTREDAGPLLPDFLLLDRDLDKAMLLDLKLPSAKIVVDKPNRERFSALVDEARSQLLEYRDWFEDAHNRATIKDRFGMEIYRPRLGVVIGSSAEFESSFQRQKLASRYPDIEVATYDDILAHAHRRLALVKSALPTIR